MLVKSKNLKIIALIVWGILLFLLISNQEMSLKDIRTTKYLPLKSSEYEFTQSGYAAEDLTKYRVVKNGKTFLFGFSDADEFINHLNLIFETTKRINFDPTFHPTKGCTQDKAPDRFSLFVTVNDMEHRLQLARDEHGGMALDIPANAQTDVRVQVPEKSCGSIKLVMTRVQTGSVVDYLLVNGLWMAYIFLMLISRRLFLPLLSGVIFYLYLEADGTYSDVFSWEQICLYSSIAISSGLILSILLSFGKNNFASRILTRIISFLLLVAACYFPITVLAFNSVFDLPMSEFDWFAVMQTNIAEASEFITVFAPDDLIITVLSGCALFLAVLWASARASSRFIVIQGLLLLLCIPFAVLFYDQSPVLNKSLSAISNYNEGVALAKANADRRKKDIGSIKATKRQSGEVYVIILGESANRDHFSIYGYPPITTPRLSARYDAGDLIRYDQAYSGGTSTRGSLGWALTSSTVKKGSPNSSPSIIEELNAADFETYWLKNGNTGVGRNILGLFAGQAKYTDRLNPIFGLEDGKLLAELEKALANSTSKNKAIFLSTQGSHIAYCKRLPVSDYDDWVFKDKDFYSWLIPDKYKLNYISAGADCYDGTVKYTDYLIDEVIERVKRAGKVASVAYFSDHGEEIVRGTAHMGNPTYGVFSVPMFLWFSEGYQKLYPQKYTNAKENSKRVFINDVMFDSLLGFMSVETKESQLNNDISGSQFKDRKWVYRGRRTVYEVDNYIYYTPRNITAITAVERPYQVYLGPLEHPFHLSWVTRENRYNYIALSSVYQEGVFNLNSPLYREKSVMLETVLKYLRVDPSQKLLLRVEQGMSDASEVEKVASQLLSLLNEFGIDKAGVEIVSSNRSLIDALTSLEVRVSYIVSGELLPATGGFQYEAVSIDLNDFSQLQNANGAQAIDLWVTACGINSCDAQFFQQLDLLAGKVNIRNVIIPMFDL